VTTRITVARSVEDVKALADAWSDLGAADVNADRDVFLAMLETRPDSVRPHVLVAEADGAPRAMLVARLERTRIPIRVGYKQLSAPRVRALTVVQGGLLGAEDGHAVPLLFDEAQRSLARGEADVLRLRCLRVGSELHRLARERPSWPVRGHAAQPFQRWRLILPDSLDDVLRQQSSRTRSNHRRYARKLEEEFGDRLSFAVFRDPADLDRVIRDSQAVSAKTYQHQLGAGFTADPSARRLLEIGAERGWLRAYVLSLDDEPCAFWLGNAYGGVFFTGPTGYDPSLANLRVGTYVLMKMIEDLCADDSVEEVDYGIGDAEYKRHFGSQTWLEEDTLVFAPSVRGVRVNMTRTAVLSAAGAARRVAGGERIASVKKRWRERLSARGERGTR
jgi:CelD/BcsL family acetyltransferase involved in cellulose biosynthesis